LINFIFKTTPTVISKNKIIIILLNFTKTPAVLITCCRVNYLIWVLKTFPLTPILGPCQQQRRRRRRQRAHDSIIYSRDICIYIYIYIYLFNFFKGSFKLQRREDRSSARK